MRLTFSCKHLPPHVLSEQDPLPSKKWGSCLPATPCALESILQGRNRKTRGLGRGFLLAKGTKSICASLETGIPAWEPSVETQDHVRTYILPTLLVDNHCQVANDSQLAQSLQGRNGTYLGVQGWETSRSHCMLNIVGGCMGSQKTHSLS